MEKEGGKVEEEEEEGSCRTKDGGSFQFEVQAVNSYSHLDNDIFSERGFLFCLEALNISVVLSYTFQSAEGGREQRGKKEIVRKLWFRLEDWKPFSYRVN